MSLSRKLLILTFLPALLLVGLAALLIGERWTRVGQSAAVAYHGRAALVLDSALTELQRERGRSAIYLAGPAGPVPAALAAQREASDRRLAELRTLADADRDAFAPALHAGEGLDGLRASIDGRGPDAAQAIPLYTQRIGALLANSVAFTRATVGSDTINGAFALNVLEAVTERAGQARATGAAALAAGHFTAAQLTRLASLAEQEKLLIDWFDGFAPPDAQQGLQKALASDDSRAYADMLARTLVTEPGAAPKGLTGENWFAAATRRIDAMNGQRAELAQALTIHADGVRVGSLREAGLVGAGVAAALALMIALGVSTQRGLARPIGQIVGALRRLAAGEIDFSIPAVRSTVTEILHLGDALRAFHETMRARRADLELETERQRAAEERAAAESLRTRLEAERAEVSRVVGEALERLAHKRLDHRIGANFPNEFESLKQNYNLAARNLDAALAGAAESAAQVEAQAHEIDAASDDLAGRAARQAARLEESRAAMRALGAAVEGAENASTQARASADAARTEVSANAETAQRAVEAIKNIQSSSQRIGAIVGVIDEIAFQTNLLALNAGVEAARAGDAGRGFAVVATEVRALASRSAGAAREIKELIARAEREVGIGVGLVEAAGAAFARVEFQVAGVDAGIADIAQRAREQAQRIAEVEAALAEFEQITQANAAMAEEAHAASRGLNAETARLDGLLRAFALTAPDPLARAA